MIKRIIKAVKNKLDYLRQRRIESHMDPKQLALLYEANKEWLDSQHETNIDEELLLRKAQEKLEQEKYKISDIESMVDISQLREFILGPEKKQDSDFTSEYPEDLSDDVGFKSLHHEELWDDDEILDHEELWDDGEILDHDKED